MRDGGTHNHGPGAGVDGGAALGGRVHVALADDGQIGELGRGLAQQRQVRTLVQRGLDLLPMYIPGRFLTASKPSSIWI